MAPHKLGNTKRVWLDRHAKQNAIKDPHNVWQCDSGLFPESIDRIIVAADYFKSLGINFTLYRHSLLRRSEQTCVLLKDQMGSAADIKLNHLLGPGEEGLWNNNFFEWMQANPSWEKMVVGPATWVSLWPDLCTREGGRVLNGVRHVARELNDGEHAVCIGHNPLIQLAEWSVTGAIAEVDLKYCQAICFVFQGETICDVEQHLI